MPDGGILQNNDALVAYRAGGANNGNITIKGSAFAGVAPGTNQVTGLFNNNGIWGWLTTATINGINGTIQQYFQAADELYLITQGMDVDPRYFGAMCNGRMITSSYGGSILSSWDTSGNLSIPGYTFQNCVAGPGNSCDIGKVAILFTNADSGPPNYIASVNTGTNVAKLGRNPSFASTPYNTGVILEGAPSDGSTPSLAQDDSNAIHNAMAFSAIFHGGRVKLPPNCGVHNMQGASNAELVGNDGGLPYTGPQLPSNSVTPLYAMSNGYMDNPAMGIDAGSASHMRFRDFTMMCPIFPYSGFAGLQLAGIGATHTTSNDAEGNLTDHVGFVTCPVGLGSPWGLNQAVAFTASISGNQLIVTSIDSDNFGIFSTFNNPTGKDWLAVGRTITGAGIPGGVTITAANNPPDDGQASTYTISTNLVVSSEAMVSPANQFGMGGQSRFDQFTSNIFGINGNLTDWSDDFSSFTGNDTGIHLGPQTAPYGCGADQFNTRRFEEDTRAGIIIDGCQNIVINGTQFQFERGQAIRTMGSWADIQYTGGLLQGSSGGVSTLNDRVHIQLGGTGNRFSVSGVQVLDTNFDLTSGPWTKYVFEIPAGSTVNDISWEGGNGQTGFTTAVWSPASAIPSRYKQSIPSLPFIDTTQSVLNANLNGTVGIGTSPASTNAGSILDMSGAGAAQSSFVFPQGTTGNRPGTPAAGMARYNTSTGLFEGYNGSLWGSIGGPPSVLPNYLGGLTLSNDPTTPNSIIDVGPGTSASDDNSIMMNLASSYTKTTGSWAVGSGNGCLDAGSVANNTKYNVFEMERTDTLVVDILCSTSATSPTLPANYTVQRRLNCGFETDGSAHILPFNQNGDDCLWAVSTVDVNTATLGTTASLKVLNVPVGVKVQPICSASMSNDGHCVLLSSPDQTDAAPNCANPMTTTPGATLIDTTIAAGMVNTTCPTLVTNTAGQIRARADAASTTLSIITQGWKELHLPAGGALAIDGTATNTGVTTQTATATLSTTNGHDIIMLWVLSAGNATDPSVNTVTDASGLTWTLRKRFNYRSSTWYFEEWYAITPAPLSSDVITVTMNSAGAYNTRLMTYGVTGANTANPFDSNVSVPAANESTPGGGTSSITISTTHGNDMLLTAWQAQAGTFATRPTGFSPAATLGNNPDTSYQIVTVPQTSLTLSYTYTGSGANTPLMADAIRGAGP